MVFLLDKQDDEVFLYLNLSNPCTVYHRVNESIYEVSRSQEIDRVRFGSVRSSRCILEMTAQSKFCIYLVDVTQHRN